MCSLRWWMSEPLGCKGCGGILTGRRRKWCSAVCEKRAGRDAYMVATYGITLIQWEELLEFQGGVCACCKRPPYGRRVLVVDHEHNKGPSGRLRGLICSVPCNLKIIGKHKSGELLRSAADYLDNPPGVQLFGEIICPGRKPKKRQPRKRRR